MIGSLVLATNLAVCCPIVELRQYTLKPGQRDVLIALFDREFVDPQEAGGIRVVGHFRDLDDPDRFVWIRGFPDMPVRALALEAFYSGPVWKAHREAANATMIDSDNVLLLHPAATQSGFRLDGLVRPGLGKPEPSGGLIVATIEYPKTATENEFAAFFEQHMAPAVEAAGGRIRGRFVTDSSPNTFPRLPVREGEHVFVWFAGFEKVADYDAYREALGASPLWKEALKERASRIDRETESRRLVPAPRSLLRN